MKKAIGILLIALGIWSCNSTSSKIEGKSNDETSDSILNAENKPTIFIKDSSLYDSAFVNGLKDFKESFQVIDNYVINANDTTWFPRIFQ